MPATIIARIGATSAGIATFSIRPSPNTALAPSAANAEPTTPPISACELDDGRPKYQVARFHAIAPTSPANTIGGVTTAARLTATRGFSARVEIEVATALAVS